MTISNDMRAYWRQKQREHRASKRGDTIRTFKPRILSWALCSYCEGWHPLRAILPTSEFATFSLDSFHDRAAVEEWTRNVELVADEPGTLLNPMETCIAWQMKEEGAETEEQAKANCEVLISGVSTDTHWKQFLKQKDQALISNLYMCIHSRVQFYKESESIAKHNCEILLNDPFMRHFPPGLIAPADLDPSPNTVDAYDLSDEDHVDREELSACFAEKVNDGTAPLQAVKECVVEIGFKKSMDALKESRKGVGNLYGKSRAEIAAMSGKSAPDPSLTVSRVSLFGKTKKQILEEQRRRGSAS